MVGPVSGSRTVKDIVEIEKVFPLHSLAEETAARCINDILKDVKTPMVQDSIIQELEEELGWVKRKNESFEGRLNKYKVSGKSSETKLEEDERKIPALVKQFKEMEQE